MRRGYLSIPATAALLDVHQNTVRRLIAAGDLPATRIGKGRGIVRIRVADVEAMTAARPVVVVGR